MSDDEVEITPEMIEAGIREMVRYDPRFDRLEDAVADIYETMERARRKRVAEMTGPGTYTCTVGQGGSGGAGGGTSSFAASVEGRF